MPKELTDTDAAGVEPKVTVDPLVKPDPSIVTEVPPLAGPDDGLMPVTTGV